MTQPRIFWTTREWEILARWFIDNHHDPRHRGFRPLLLEAMHVVLPEDRYRAPHSLTNAAEMLLPVYDRLLLARDQDPQAGEGEAPAAVPSTDPLRAAAEVLLDLLIARLRPAIEDVVQRELMRSKQSSPVERGGEPLGARTTPARQGGERLPRVLIVGPRNGQQQELRARFQGTAELRFVSQEEHPKLVSERGAGCDLILLHETRIGHKFAQVALALTKVQKRRVRGATTEVERSLKEWLVSSKTAA